MRLWLFIGYDADQQQSFWDVIPAETIDKATERWSKVRGSYADVVDSFALTEEDRVGAPHRTSESFEKVALSMIGVTIDEAEAEQAFAESVIDADNGVDPDQGDPINEDE